MQSNGQICDPVKKPSSQKSSGTFLWKWLLPKKTIKETVAYQSRLLGTTYLLLWFFLPESLLGSVRATRFYLPSPTRVTSYISSVLQNAQTCQGTSALRNGPGCRAEELALGLGFTVSACHVLISRSNDLLREIHDCDPVSAYC